MSLSTAQQLREIADKIDSFPKFIRRDAGSISLEERVQDILRPFELHTNKDLCEAILGLTEAFRITSRTYYMGQFDNDA